MEKVLYNRKRVYGFMIIFIATCMFMVTRIICLCVVMDMVMDMVMGVCKRVKYSEYTDACVRRKVRVSYVVARKLFK